jgi:AraC-like DNA-binding protein
MQYIIGIFLSFFLVVLIITKKDRTRSDIFLGIWITIIGMQIFGYYSFISGLMYQYPKLMWINLPYEFLHGPMLYLFVKSLTNPERFKKRKWLLHFALPLLIVISIFPILTLPENERIVFYKTNGKGFEIYLFDWSVLMIITGLIYIYATGALLYNHKKRIHHQFSYEEKINLNWLWFLIFGMSTTWAIIISGGSDKWIFSTSSILMVFIGFFGIKQAGIFTDQQFELSSNNELEIEANTTTEVNLEKKKYAKSSLTDDTAKQLQEQLKLLMKQDKLFAIPELTLTDLANKLAIHPNYLSQVINDLEGMNFYNYINTLRVEEFIKLVSKPQNKKYTFLSLAYECGFNSKTTFNRFFKKVTGLSPTEYLNNLSID